MTMDQFGSQIPSPYEDAGHRQFVVENIEISEVVNQPAYRIIKRLIDISGSFWGLLLLSPIFLIVAIIIKLDSPGPIFYRWNIVGRGGRLVRSHKFRTMVVNADELKAKLADINEMVGPVFKIKNDPRITPVGRFLRKYSIDELPQLWSVLKGDMSLVGPRPPTLTEWVNFEPWHRRKLSVTPGITCLWQVSGRNNIANFDQWVCLDLQYIDRWSLWLDFKIMVQTVRAVLLGTGK